MEISQCSSAIKTLPALKKTEDITKIKGWKKKQFANETSSAVEDNVGVREGSELDECRADDICVNGGRSLHEACVEPKSMCAFVCDDLDNYLDENEKVQSNAECQDLAVCDNRLPVEDLPSTSTAISAASTENTVESSHKGCSDASRSLQKENTEGNNKSSTGALEKNFKIYNEIIFGQKGSNGLLKKITSRKKGNGQEESRGVLENRRPLTRYGQYKTQQENATLTVAVKLNQNEREVGNPSYRKIPIDKHKKTKLVIHVTVQRKKDRKEFGRVYLVPDSEYIGYVTARVYSDETVILEEPLYNGKRIRRARILDVLNRIIKKKVKYIPQDLDIKWDCKKSVPNINHRKPLDKNYDPVIHRRLKEAAEKQFKNRMKQVRKEFQKEQILGNISRVSFRRDASTEN